MEKESDYKFTGYNRDLASRAKALRKNATREENTLWFQYLRNYPVKFYRQRAIEHYIVDFYCSQAKLVIELDGSQHFTEAGLAYDSIRTDILQKHGLDVLRITNTDIKQNFRGVCEWINLTVRERLGR